MAKAKLSQTKGKKVQLDFGSKIVKFTAGGKKRASLGGGAVYVNGEIKDSKGNRYYAILELDESSSGEYYGGMYFEPQLDGAFIVKEILGNIGNHSYKYHASLHCDDHHVGIDGWSI